MHKNVWYSTPVLCNVSHLIFPWLKSPIIIESPLVTSLIALCNFSLFCLVMLGQRYTTPMVTVVCPVTNLHHMASLQSLLHRLNFVLTDFILMLKCSWL